MINDAIKLAKSNNIILLPKMAAIIYKRKKILGVGMNSYKSHPMQKRFSIDDKKIFLHAEIDALKNALKEHDASELIGAEIIVARIMKNGKCGFAKPCDICQKALTEYKLSGIYWTEYE